MKHAIACAAIFFSPGCIAPNSSDVERQAESLSPGVSEDGIVYCDGAAECVSATCEQSWCQPVRDEPNPEGRWGVCRTITVADGGTCDGGRGTCGAGACLAKPPAQPPVYAWSNDGPDAYSFGHTATYTANITDPDALVVYVPYAGVGDELQIEVNAAAHAD